MKSFHSEGKELIIIIPEYYKITEKDSQLFKELGKQVRTMPQIKIDDEVIGGYNQLVEYFADKGKPPRREWGIFQLSTALRSKWFSWSES